MHPNIKEWIQWFYYDPMIVKSIKWLDQLFGEWILWFDNGFKDFKLDPMLL